MKEKRALAEAFTIPYGRDLEDTSEYEAEQAVNCTLPTRMTQDGNRWFRVNEPDMPLEHTQALDYWWDHQLPYEELPRHLVQYETDVPQESREHAVRSKFGRCIEAN